MKWLSEATYLLTPTIPISALSKATRIHAQGHANCMALRRGAKGGWRLRFPQSVASAANAYAQGYRFVNQEK